MPRSPRRVLLLGALVLCQSEEAKPVHKPWLPLAVSIAVGGVLVYGTLALGWQGTTTQWHRLEAGMQIMAVAIIPVAVSVHSIVSFDFSMATTTFLVAARMLNCMQTGTNGSLVGMSRFKQPQTA